MDQSENKTIAVKPGQFARFVLGKVGSAGLYSAKYRNIEKIEVFDASGAYVDTVSVRMVQREDFLPFAKVPDSKFAKEDAIFYERHSLPMA